MTLKPHKTEDGEGGSIPQKVTFAPFPGVTIMPHIPLSDQDVADIINGAAFLGAGGGGPRDMANLLRQQIMSGKSVVLLDEGGLQDDAWYAVVAFMGSPQDGSKVTQPFHSPTLALQALSKQTGHNFTAILPVEIGAVNSLTPLLVSSELGIPVLDCDGAGRAVPELMMLTFASLPNIAQRPFFIVAESGESAAGQVKSTSDAEDLCRGILSTTAFGGISALSIWPMTGKEVRSTGIFGGIRRAQSLGAALRNAKAQGNSPLTTALTWLNGTGTLLFSGTVRSVTTTIVNSLDFGTVVIEGADGVQFVIITQNENMFCWRSDTGSPVLMSPDALCYLGADGSGLSNVEVKVGLNLYVIGVQALAPMRSPAIVKAFLNAFRPLGYGGSYLPFQGATVASSPSAPFTNTVPKE